MKTDPGFEQIPAQSRARTYLQQALRLPAKQYIVGGHSKGGNLALYAALHCEAEEREKIMAIYSNDGPGICPEFLNMELFAQIRNRYYHFVPELSVVGMLFHEGIKSIVVKSCETGIMQHNGMTWQIDRGLLARGNGLTDESRNYSVLIYHTGNYAYVSGKCETEASILTIPFFLQPTKAVLEHTTKTILRCSMMPADVNSLCSMSQLPWLINLPRRWKRKRRKPAGNR